MKVNSQVLQKYAVFGMLILLFIIFSIFAKSFLLLDNLMNLLVQSTILGIVGFCLAYIMIAGEIDLSYAGSIPLEGAVFAALLSRNTSYGFSIICVIGIGLLISLVVSQLVTQFKLVSYITTIAMMFLLQGIWYVLTGGKNVFLAEEQLNREWIFGNVGPFPRIVIFYIILFVILFIISEYSAFGLRLRAVGTDPESTRASGLNPKVYKTCAFLIGGAIFAIGSILTTARMSGALATSGSNLLMPVMTVAFVGQTFIGMGRPNIPGVFLASLLLAMIDNAFVLMQLPIWSVPMANGVILISAIYLANFGKKEIIQIKF
jgi:ribose transport system permease protein